MNLVKLSNSYNNKNLFNAKDAENRSKEYYIKYKYYQRVYNNYDNTLANIIENIQQACYNGKFEVHFHEIENLKWKYPECNVFQNEFIPDKDEINTAVTEEGYGKLSYVKFNEEIIDVMEEQIKNEDFPRKVIHRLDCNCKLEQIDCLMMCKDKLIEMNYKVTYTLSEEDYDITNTFTISW